MSALAKASMNFRLAPWISSIRPVGGRAGGQGGEWSGCDWECAT